MLPQAVLDAPRRAGHKHAKAAAAYTVDRLQRWEAGERMTLWDTRHKVTVRHGGHRTAAERRDFALGLAREGFDGKACAALLAEGLCPATLKQWLSSAHSTLPSPLLPCPMEALLLALTSPQLRSAAPCEASRLPRYLARQACEFSTSATRASRAALMCSSTTS